MKIKNEKFEANCKGLFLPMEVLKDNDLTLEDTAILMIIDALDSAEKHCTASNEYIGNCFGFSENKVSLSISKLIKLGYVTKLGFNGRIRVLQSNVKQIVAKIDSINKETYKDQTLCASKSEFDAQ